MRSKVSEVYGLELFSEDCPFNEIPDIQYIIVVNHI